MVGRDPIEEGGGYNLYGFVGNEPVGRWDMYGLKFFMKILGDAGKLDVSGQTRVMAAFTNGNPEW